MSEINSPDELEAHLNLSGAPEVAERQHFWDSLNGRLRFFDARPPLRYRVSPAGALSPKEVKHPWWVVICREGNDYEVLLDDALYAGHPDTPYVLDRAFLVVTAACFSSVFSDSSSAKTTVCLKDEGDSSMVSFTGVHDDAPLIPDTSYIQNLAHEWFNVGVVRNWVPWHDRRPIAIWRGALHGVASHIPTDDWSWLPRAHLCAQAERAAHKASIDAKLTNVTDMSKWVREHYPDHARSVCKFFGDSIEPLRHMDYRFQIDIDGTANAWSGLFRKLLTGSVVLKVTSQKGFRQWYYHLLKPGIHYVPVKADLTDLDEALDFVLTNDDDARRIGSAGRDVALSLSLDREIYAMSAVL